jgi:hypothetical protein
MRNAASRKSVSLCLWGHEAKNVSSHIVEAIAASLDTVRGSRKKTTFGFEALTKKRHLRM